MNIFFFYDNTKTMTLKVCIKCKFEKDTSQFRICKMYKNTEIKYLRNDCISCEKIAAKQLNHARKNAPPKPIYCQCCNEKTNQLVLDHDHESGEFRGWICRNCNHGIGKLGDTLEGLEKAVLYLKSYKK